MMTGTPRPSHTPILMAPLRLSLSLATLLVTLAAPVHAAIRIDISGVDGPLRRNVLALLSVEHYKDRDRIEPDAVARLFRRVDGEVRDALRPYGYYAPDIKASLVPEDNERNWRVHIAIKPGDPVRLDQISVLVRGAGALEEAFTRITATHTLSGGDRLEHAKYESVKSELQLAAESYGYLDWRMVRSELQVDPRALRANVFLELETGERYKFGATKLEQTTIREPQLRRYLRYREGDPYDAGKLLRTQFALDDSQFFSGVDVTRGELDRVQHIVPITIAAKTARSAYSFGPGYGTDTGKRITVSWLNPRVNDRGHRLRMQIQASNTTQSLNARYDVPFGDPVLDKFSLLFLTQNLQISGGVTTKQYSFGPSVTQSFGRWQRVLSTNAVWASTTDAVNGRQIDKLIVPGITYAAVPAGYLGQDLFAHAFKAELLGSAHALGANANFLRLDLQAERVFNFTELWHLLLRSELGTSIVGRSKRTLAVGIAGDAPELPGIYRFYAGGDRTLRGFSFDQLSPFDYKTVLDQQGRALLVSARVGGRHIFTGTVEVERDLPNHLGIAAFSDFGNAFDSFRDPLLAVSLGLGVRYRLPVVTVGLDVGKAVHAPSYSPPAPLPHVSLPGPRIHVNISVKL